MDLNSLWPPITLVPSYLPICLLVSSSFQSQSSKTYVFLDLLKRSAPSRIVVVASSLYQLTSLNLNNLNPSSSWFPPWIYYPSKYANISFTLELARRLEGSGVTANCLHPGLIDSGIWRNVPVPLNWPLKVIVKCFFKSPEQGKFTTFLCLFARNFSDPASKYLYTKAQNSCLQTIKHLVF